MCLSVDSVMISQGALTITKQRQHANWSAFTERTSTSLLHTSESSNVSSA